MSVFKNHCFVCGKPVTDTDSTLNQEVNLPVCVECKGSEMEKRAVEEQLDSLADGLVCGCI